MKEYCRAYHHVDIILHFCQRMIIFVHVHLHLFIQRLRIVAGRLQNRGVKLLYLQSVVVLIALAWGYSQVIFTWEQI